MDVDDVSGSDKYIGYLHTQKAILQAAKARDGEIPKDRKSQSQLVHKHQMMALQNMMQKIGKPMEHQIHSSFLPPPYPPSIAKLDDLTPIFIRDLQLGVHHRGRYLRIKAVTTPNRMTAIMAVVEDEQKDAVVVQIYQQPDASIRPTTSVITTGDTFLVKEPFFKVMGDGEYGLRIDHVTDLVRIDARHKLWPKSWIPNSLKSRTPEDLKQEGNIAMGRKQHWDAIQSYTKALESDPFPAEEAIIRLNRALAYLRDERFEAALADTMTFDPNPNTSLKALYRAGKALYGLGRLQDSCDILTTLHEKYPDSSEGAKELERARLRLQEKEHGVYDWKAMYEEVAQLRPPHLDHATFIGPIATKNSPGKGRGLFTTKDVKAGDLLMCEKAFAHCYAPSTDESVESGSKMSCLINITTDRVTLGTQGDLITAIVQKLLRNPSLLPEFLTMHHGSYEAVGVVEVDGSPVIDTFMVEKIISLNCFGCPLNTRDGYLHGTTKREEIYHSCGVWPLASRINHACTSNVRRSFIGDMQIVRATCDIPADTELAFWYKIPTGDHYEMKKGLEHWGFECLCAICLDSKNTAKKVSRKRNDLLGDLKSTLDAKHVDMAKAERLLNAAGQTYKYPPSEVPRLQLRGSYSRLIDIYSGHGNAGKVILISLKALECLGFVIRGAESPFSSEKILRVEKWGIMMDGVSKLWVHLWNAYAALAPHLMSRAAEIGKLTYKICVGEDVTFKESCDPEGELG